MTIGLFASSGSATSTGRVATSSLVAVCRDGRVVSAPSLGARNDAWLWYRRVTTQRPLYSENPRNRPSRPLKKELICTCSRRAARKDKGQMHASCPRYGGGGGVRRHAITSKRAQNSTRTAAHSQPLLPSPVLLLTPHSSPHLSFSRPSSGSHLSLERLLKHGGGRCPAVLVLGVLLEAGVLSPHCL